MLLFKNRHPPGRYKIIIKRFILHLSLNENAHTSELKGNKKTGEVGKTRF
jgi:hypothetical protein